MQYPIVSLSMPRANSQDPESGIVPVDDRLDQPPSPLNQSFQGETKFGDGSGPLFTLYSKIAEEEDNKMVGRWQKDAEGIVIFNGLFSAVIAVLVVVSVQDLRPKSQDISAFYLKNIYQLLADPNFPRPSDPSALPALAGPPAFSPPRSSVWVNALWFLSLVISLSCTMLATSLQQSARRYIRITQPARCSPHKRARLRAFFANGVDELHVPWAVEALPVLVHLSLLIFFVGLLIYLFNIHHAVFSAVILWLALLSLAYGCITLMPIFRHDSPYYAPLSSTAWSLYSGVMYAILEVTSITAQHFSSLGTCHRICGWKRQYGSWIWGGVERAADEDILKRSTEIDVHVLKWTVGASDEDDTLEKFVESIPGFLASHEVKILAQDVQSTVPGALRTFLHRTLSSNVVSESVKTSRLSMCLNAASKALDSDGIGLMFVDMIHENWGEMPHAVEIGHFLRSWDKGTNGRFSRYIQGVIARILASVRERDDRWVALALDHFGISESVLQDYLMCGDSVLLANLTHFIRHANRSHHFSLYVVRSLVSAFEIRNLNTLPGLQNDFCALWNDVVLEAQDGGAECIPTYLLVAIHSVYAAIHRGTDVVPIAPFSHSTRVSDIADVLLQPSSYPLCNVPDHRPDSTHHVHEAAVEEASQVHPHASTGTSIAIPRHRDTVLATTTVTMTSPFLPRSQNSDGTTTRPEDEPSIRDLGLPNGVITFAHPAPQAPPSNLALPPLPFSLDDPDVSYR